MATEHSRRIGARIRERRVKLGLKQKELAALIDPDGATGVDGQRISDWERGVNKPSDRYWPGLVEALGRPLAWFHAAEVDEAMPDLDEILTSSERIERLEAKLDAQSELIRQLLERFDAEN